MKILILSVPRSSPTNVTAQSTGNPGNRALIASWKPVPPGHEQGFISMVRQDTRFFMRTQHNPKRICSSILSVNLTCLQVYTYYCVQVSAFTMASERVLSECVVKRKDEGGTRNDFLIFFSPDAFMTAISVLVPIFQLFYTRDKSSL